MGWKAFWSEIVIVVLGVAIALAANEAMQDWSWHGKVVDGQMRLQEDSQRVFQWSAEQYATQPCIGAQLDRLSRRLLESGEVLEPAPTFFDNEWEIERRFVVRLPYRSWRMPVWEALVADGTATRFPRESQLAYGRMQELAEMNLALRMESSRLGGRLLALSRPLPLDAAARREFVVDIESLRSTTAKMPVEIAMAHLESAGLAPAPALVDDYLAESGTVSFCKSHGFPVSQWRDYRQASIALPFPSIAPARP